MRQASEALICFPGVGSLGVEELADSSSVDMVLDSWMRWIMDIGTWCRGMQYQKAAIWRAWTSSSDLD